MNKRTFHTKTLFFDIRKCLFTGFFYADRTLGYSFANTWPPLEISISNKKAIDCEIFTSLFNNNIYLDKRYNTYKQVISSKENILFLYTYLQNYSLQSYKHKQILLIPDFFKLRQMRAYNYPKETKTYQAIIRR